MLGCKDSRLYCCGCSMNATVAAQGTASYFKLQHGNPMMTKIEMAGRRPICQAESGWLWVFTERATRSLDLSVQMTCCGICLRNAIMACSSKHKASAPTPNALCRKPSA